MYFLKDDNKKIIFGWSAKCGCSHVKNLFCYLTDRPLYVDHIGSHGVLPHNHTNYKIIIFVRDPYERLVSGFLQRYDIGKECHSKWVLNKNAPELTFNNFVNELFKHGARGLIDTHHFTQQLSEKWDPSINIHRVYDIISVDYDYIGKLFSKVIPNEVINYRGKNVNIKIPYTGTENISNLNIKYYSHTSPKTEQFYTPDIIEKVRHVYDCDFKFIQQWLPHSLKLPHGLNPLQL